MSERVSASKVRLIAEVVLVMIAYFVIGGILVVLFYLADAGFTMTALEALKSPEASELLLGPAILSLPLAMILTVLVVFGLQRLKGESLRELGLKAPPSWVKTGLAGVGLALFLFLFAVGLQYLLSQAGLEHDMSDFSIIVGDPLMFIFGLTAVSWVAAAFGEEVLFRGFIMRNFYQLFGSTRGAVGGAIILQALIFGALHLNQALAGGIAVFSIAIVFGIAFYKMGRSLWPLIIAHGVYDNAALILLYLGVDA